MMKIEILFIDSIESFFNGKIEITNIPDELRCRMLRDFSRELCDRRNIIESKVRDFNYMISIKLSLQP